MTPERRTLAQQIAAHARRAAAGLAGTSGPTSMPTGMLVDARHTTPATRIDVGKGSREFAYTDEPNPSDVADRPDLRVRLHREAVERAGEMVGQATPWHSDAGTAHAEITLGLVERLLRDAVRLVDHDPATAGTPQLDPAALGKMIAALGHVTEAAEQLLSASMRQVAAARLPATRGAFVAPPGADPLSEIDAILGDLNVALHNVEMTTTRLDQTGHRLARVDRKIDPPARVRMGGPGPC